MDNVDLIKLERADFVDAEELSGICKKSFDQEIMNKYGQAGGPLGYDDPDWHVYSMKEGVYHKILYNHKVVGGIIIAYRGKKNDLYHWELVQIYVHPDYWNKGIGTFAVTQIEKWFPEMYKFTTGTPSFSKNNIKFYLKLGFSKIGESFGERDKINIILFEKLYMH